MKDLNDHIAARVITILARQALIEPDQVRLDASLESLGLDSLGVVEVIFGIEEAFDISVPFNANAPEADRHLDLAHVAGVIAAVRDLVDGQEG